eukprot:5765113-Amphidinium_carterae.1
MMWFHSLKSVKGLHKSLTYILALHATLRSKSVITTTDGPQELTPLRSCHGQPGLIQEQARLMQLVIYNGNHRGRRVLRV